MISHKYKCIFIHIPKCAGTSIETLFGHVKGHQGRGGQDHRSIRMIEPISIDAFRSRENLIELLRRMKYMHLSKCSNPRNRYIVNREQFNAYFKFTFVRNPWARAFSWYKNVMVDKVHQKKYGVSESTSFGDFLSMYIGKGVLRRQTDWIKNFKGNDIMDYIGKFENLTDDFQKVCQHMNLPDLKLPHKMKGSGEDYHKYYDPHLIELVNRYYEQEIIEFNYSF